MNYQYKDVDEDGLEILSVLSSANKLNHWMYKNISPYCTGNILEIGSGIGNISHFFIEEKRSIFLSDIRSNYRSILKDKFGLNEDRILDIDIVHPKFSVQYSQLLGTFDSIFCLNVVEHIKDDELAIENMTKLLKKNGTLAVLVPANPALFNRFDITLEHYRRYTKKSLSTLMKKYGVIEKAFYFNAVGMVGWWISGTVLRHKSLPEGEVKLFNRFVPVIELVDKLTFHKIGLSVTCVLRKKD